MNLLLDLNTILVALVVGHLFTLLLISAYWRDHGQEYMLNLFFAAKWLQGIGWFLQLMRNTIPQPLCISLSNSLIYVGVTVEIAALLHLMNAYTARVRRAYIFYTGFCLAGFHMILLGWNADAYRIAFVSVTSAILILYPAYLMLKDRSTSLLTRLVGGLNGLAAVSMLIRAAAVLYSGHTINLYTPSVYQTFTSLALYLNMVLGNTGFVLLLKERDDRELRRLASRDDLTGILNRRVFIEQAVKEIQRHAAAAQPLSLLVFDVDRFKEINDTYGHTGGDRILQDLAARIAGGLGPSDLFARYGGDEFSILLPGRDEAASERIIRGLFESVKGAGGRGQPSEYEISMGVITVTPDQSTTLETLYSLCDQALYDAKGKGRGRFSRAYMQPRMRLQVPSGRP